MAKIVTTVSLDPEIAAHLKQTGNASSYVNELIRQQMVREAEESSRGGTVAREAREAARAWAKQAFGKAKALPGDPAFQEARRRRLGLSA